ncbi:MAG: branched-chain amino acid ABC transporter permease [Burkholderiales bacterium]
MRFIYKTSYDQDIKLVRHSGQAFWYSLLSLALLSAPWVFTEYWLSQLTFIMIYGVIGLGLMLLSGYTGLFSMGQAAFMAVGAYCEAILTSAGWPVPVSLAVVAAITAITGTIIGIPALRIRGMYLGIATLAFGFVVVEILARWDSITGGNAGLTVGAPVLLGDQKITSPQSFYLLCLVVAALATLFTLNLLRSSVGRAFVAIRDSEISAQSMGINIARYKTLSFSISAGLSGIGGALYAHKLQFISPEQFDIIQSLDLLLLVVIGGLGSIQGAFFGAIFLITMPQLISLGKDLLPSSIGEATGLQGMVYGLVLVAFVLFEPLGIYGRWIKIRTYLQLGLFYRKGMFSRQKTFQKSDRLK